MAHVYHAPISTHIYELMIKPADKNRDNALNETELRKFQRHILTNPHADQGVQARREMAIDDLIHHFDLFDHDGDGNIDRADIRRVAATDYRNWEMSYADLNPAVTDPPFNEDYPIYQPPRYPAPQNSFQRFLQQFLPVLLRLFLGNGLLSIGQRY